MLSGMKCLAFGGIRLKNYHGRWLGSRQLMDVSLGRLNRNESNRRRKKNSNGLLSLLHFREIYANMLISVLIITRRYI